MPLVADRARGGDRLPRRQRRARDRHRRRRGRRHRAEPDRPARPGRQLGGRDQDRPDHDAEGQQAGLLLYKEPANWIKVGARRQGRDQPDRVRARQGRRLPARRAVQGRRPDRRSRASTCACAPTARMASAQYSTNGTTWTDVGKSRDISDLGAGTSARWRCAAAPPDPGHGEVRLRPRRARRRSRPARPTARPRPASSACGTASTWPPRRRPAPAASTSSTTAAPRAAAWSAAAASACCGSTPRPTTTSSCARSGSRPRTPTTPASSSASRTRARTRNVAIAQGHEIQIREGVAGDGEDQKTGSIYNFNRETARTAKPAGEWNDYEIRYEGRRVHDHAQRHGREHVHEQHHAGARGRLHRPPEPRRHRRGLVPQRARPAAGVDGDEPVHTIGITTNATRAQRPDLPARRTRTRCRPSRCRRRARSARRRATPPTTCRCGCPTRPAPSRTSPGFNGQVLTLRDVDQKAYTKLHFFGTTTDGGPAGGTFVLRYSDDTTANVTVQFPDWCSLGDDAAAHFAIGPLNGRYRTNTTGDGARCGIFHFPAQQPAAGQDARLGHAAVGARRGSTGANTRVLPDGAHARGRRRDLHAAGPLGHGRRSRTTTRRPTTAADARARPRPTATAAGTRAPSASRSRAPTRPAAPASSR